MKAHKDESFFDTMLYCAAKDVPMSQIEQQPVVPCNSKLVFSRCARFREKYEARSDGRIRFIVLDGHDVDGVKGFVHYYHYGWVGYLTRMDAATAVKVWRVAKEVGWLGRGAETFCHLQIANQNVFRKIPEPSISFFRRKLVDSNTPVISKP